MLLDLGADISSIPLEVAQHLGLNLKATPVPVHGIGGHEWAIPSEATLILSGYEGHCEIHRAQCHVTIGTDEAGQPSKLHPPSNEWPLLGRSPVMEMFDLMYNHSRRYAVLIGPDKTHPLHPRTYPPSKVPKVLAGLK